MTVEHLLDVGVAVDVVRAALRQLTSGGRGGILAGGKAVDDDVAVGDHSVQAVVVAADRQRADTQVAHVLSCCGEGFVLTHTGRTGVHDVAGGGHDVLLLSGGIPLSENVSRFAQHSVGSLDPRSAVVGPEPCSVRSRPRAGEVIHQPRQRRST